MIFVLFFLVAGIVGWSAGTLVVTDRRQSKPKTVRSARPQRPHANAISGSHYRSDAAASTTYARSRPYSKTSSTRVAGRVADRVQDLKGTRP